jgi:membrane-bound lytic murein transglycosylase B
MTKNYFFSGCLKVLVGFITAILATAFYAAPSLAGRAFTDAETKALVEIYASDGYDRAYLKKIFSDPRVTYVPTLVRMLVIPPDFSANYERFTKKAEIDRARAFSTTWRTCLKTTADIYGVDQSVIVAIVLIETSLGKNVGRSPVLSVFATLLLENSLYRDAFARQLEGNDRKDHYLKRLDDKAAWARVQLDALMTMNMKKTIDVCGIRGSYAGAFGIAQFLPTSYLNWAKSETDKRAPDLFYMPDAIISVANFLKEHGWRPGLTDEEKRSVIWHYNRSSVYVDTVLAVAAQLKGSSAP